MSTHHVGDASTRFVVILLVALAMVALLVAPRPAEARDRYINVVMTLREGASIQLPKVDDADHAHEVIIDRLQRFAHRTQAPLIRVLRTMRSRGEVASFHPLWIANSIAVRATAPAVRTLSELPEVAEVVVDDVAITTTDVVDSPLAAPGVEAIGAPTLWQAGIDGSGVVVAVLDSGVDMSHSDIAGSWVGGPHAWFDPYGQHSTPFDPTGHGTWVTGVLVGDDSHTPAVGVAPGAQWIAGRIFNDHGDASISAVHQVFQWVADPDGDPTTNDVPDIVNNSWGFATPGCDTEFQSDLLVLSQLGVVSVFSAGNTGPSADSAVSPANYPEVVSVGAVAPDSQLLSTSSRGPSSCGGRDRVFPDLVAPGSDIETTDLFEGWTMTSGTSVAAPHVSGALALLKSGRPCVSTSELAEALTSAATDLGDPGPDSSYGNGEVNVGSAWQLFVERGSHPHLSDIDLSPMPATGASTISVSVNATSPTGVWSAEVSEPGVRSSLHSSSLLPGDGSYGDCDLQLVGDVDVSTWPAGQHSLVVNAAARDGSSSTTPRRVFVVGPTDLVFADGFEGGDLGAWSSSTGLSRLAPSNRHVLVGETALRVRVQNGRRAYVTDTSPQQLESYRARFWFDSNLTGQGVTHPIIAGTDGHDSPVFKILFRLDSYAGAELRLGTGSSAGMRWSRWLPLPGGAHKIGLSWRAAGGSRATLLLDGVERAVVAGGTFEGRLESVHLGIYRGDSPELRGREWFDGFASTVSTALS